MEYEGVEGRWGPWRWWLGEKKEVKASKLGLGNKQDISLCID